MIYQENFLRERYKSGGSFTYTKKLEEEKQRFLVILYSESNEYDMKWAQLYESIFVKAKQMIPISELIKSE